MILRTLVSLGFFLLLIGEGCSQVPRHPDLLPIYSPAELKQRLLEIAATGEGGSSLMPLESSLQELEKTDPALAKSLWPEFREMEQSEDAQQRKRLAASLAEKL